MAGVFREVRRSEGSSAPVLAARSWVSGAIRSLASSLLASVEGEGPGRVAAISTRGSGGPLRPIGSARRITPRITLRPGPHGPTKI